MIQYGALVFNWKWNINNVKQFYFVKSCTNKQGMSNDEISNYFCRKSTAYKNTFNDISANQQSFVFRRDKHVLENIHFQYKRMGLELFVMIYSTCQPYKMKKACTYIIRYVTYRLTELQLRVLYLMKKKY